MTAVPDVTLNNGRTIPQFGFGVFQIKPGYTGARQELVRMTSRWVARVIAT